MVFDELLKQMPPLEVSHTELGQVISKDVAGRRVTIGDLLDEQAPAQVLASFGRTHKRRLARIKSVDELSEQEVIEVADETLNSIPAGEALAIAGYGSFTVDQLRDEVKKQTDVGRRFAEIVIQHNAFVERAVRMGKISAKSSGSIKLPDFDF